MHLMKCDHCNCFTLKKFCECKGKPIPTRSAHPARFSPDDQYSRQRIQLKKRFNILPSQLKPVKY